MCVCVFVCVCVCKSGGMDIFVWVGGCEVSACIWHVSSFRVCLTVMKEGKGRRGCQTTNSDQIKIGQKSYLKNMCFLLESLPVDDNSILTFHFCTI